MRDKGNVDRCRHSARFRFAGCIFGRSNMKPGRIRFYQKSPIFFSTVPVISLLGVAWLIFGIIYFIKDIYGVVGYEGTWLYVPNWMVVVLLIYILVRGIREWISILEYHIDFENGVITTNGDRFRRESEMVQYGLQIKISHIKSIRLIKSNYNSRKKPCLALAYSHANSYFEFTLLNGSTKWLRIELFSKKQRMQMLNIINEELGTSYDYETMYRNGELIKGGAIWNRKPKNKK